jgi:hypothetical protein
MNRTRLYRGLLFLYPRRFRRAYGPQMVQLFCDQRRDRGRRAWLTTLRDLLVSVPIRNLEAFMSMSPQGKLATAATATTIGIVVFAVVGGAFGALILMLLLVWILTSLLRQRGAVASPKTWWKLTLAGVGIFAVAFVFFGAPWPDEWREAVPGDVAWSVGFLVFVTAIVLVAVGLLGGIVQYGSRRRLTR